MGKLSSIIGIAALAGVGYYVGKKVFEKKKAEDAEKTEKMASGEYDESEIFTVEKHSTPKEKIQRASLFAVGAIKTGTEKFKEGIDEIINSDMVSKGETTVGEVKEFASEKKEQTAAFVSEKKEQTVNFVNNAKEKTVNFANDTASNLKNEIDNLKNMVTSINAAPGEANEEDIIAIEAEDDAGIPAEDIEVEVEESAEETKNEFTEAVAEADETIASIEEFPADDAVVDEIPVSDEVPATDEASLAMDEIAEAANELAAAADSMAEDIAEFAEEISEKAEEDLDDISFDTMETVDTFDFGSADKL